MRARRGLIVGWVVVAAYAGLLAVVAVDAVTEGDAPRSEAVTSGTAAAEQLIEAWERSREATFVAVGTYERRSVVSGASIASQDIVAQRPPRRLHRQLGGVEGRDDDRILLCPAPPPDSEEEPTCRLGPPGGTTYAASVQREVDGLRSILLGRTPLYSVTVGEPGCFELEQLRVDPRAPFGIEASFCFDPATGAPSGSRVRHEGGVEEVLVVTTIRTEVTDRDLEP